MVAIKRVCYMGVIEFQGLQMNNHVGGHSMANGYSSGNGELSKTNLYIRGLLPNTKDEDLVELCESWVYSLIASLL